MKLAKIVACKEKYFQPALKKFINLIPILEGNENNFEIDVDLCNQIFVWQNHYEIESLLLQLDEEKSPKQTTKIRIQITKQLDHLKEIIIILDKNKRENTVDLHKKTNDLKDRFNSKINKIISENRECPIKAFEFTFKIKSLSSNNYVIPFSIIPDEKIGDVIGKMINLYPIFSTFTLTINHKHVGETLKLNDTFGDYPDLFTEEQNEYTIYLDNSLETTCRNMSIYYAYEMFKQQRSWPPFENYGNEDPITYESFNELKSQDDTIDTVKTRCYREVVIVEYPKGLKRGFNKSVLYKAITDNGNREPMTNTTVSDLFLQKLKKFVDSPKKDPKDSDNLTVSDQLFPVLKLDDTEERGDILSNRLRNNALRKNVEHRKHTLLNKLCNYVNNVDKKFHPFQNSLGVNASIKEIDDRIGTIRLYRDDLSYRVDENSDAMKKIFNVQKNIEEMRDKIMALDAEIKALEQ